PSSTEPSPLSSPRFAEGGQTVGLGRQLAHGQAFTEELVTAATTDQSHVETGPAPLQSEGDRSGLHLAPRRRGEVASQRLAGEGTAPPSSAEPSPLSSPRFAEGGQPVGLSRQLAHAQAFTEDLPTASPTDQVHVGEGPALFQSEGDISG